MAGAARGPPAASCAPTSARPGSARVDRVRRAYLAAARGRAGGPGAAISSATSASPRAEWIEGAAAAARGLAPAGGTGDPPPGAVVEPLGAVRRSRWLVSLVGPSAAAWPLGIEDSRGAGPRGAPRRAGAGRESLPRGRSKTCSVEGDGARARVARGRKDRSEPRASCASSPGRSRGPRLSRWPRTTWLAVSRRPRSRAARRSARPRRRDRPRVGRAHGGRGSRGRRDARRDRAPPRRRGRGTASG